MGLRGALVAGLVRVVGVGFGIFGGRLQGRKDRRDAGFELVVLVVGRAGGIVVGGAASGPCVSISAGFTGPINPASWGAASCHEVSLSIILAGLLSCTFLPETLEGPGDPFRAGIRPPRDHFVTLRTVPAPGIPPSHLADG